MKGIKIVLVRLTNGIYTQCQFWRKEIFRLVRLPYEEMSA